MNQSGARMIGLAVRTILALAALGWALSAYRYAAVATLRANAPVEAAKIAPQDAKALANTLGRRIDSNPEFKPRAGDLFDIRSALRAQPLEPKLLSIIGLVYEASGDTKRATDNMRVANLASRRDSVSGLYLIESASASGDVKETLAHYNAVLSTHPELNSVLLPILSSAITYPEIRTELRPYLEGGGRWVHAFLTVAIENSDLTDLQALLLPVPKLLLSMEYSPIIADVLHRIAVEGDRVSASRFASAAIPGLAVATLSDFSFDPATFDTRLGQFAWTFPPNNRVQVEVGKDQGLQINVEPLAHDIVAMRDLLLEGGEKYQLDQSLEYGADSERIDARWSADCIIRAGAMRIWEQRMPIMEGKASFKSTLVVPQNCSVVRMTLSVTGPEGQIPATMVINRISISRN